MMHDYLAILVAAVCLWAIISPRIHTGIVCTVGLALVSVAAIWSIDDYTDPYRALDIAWLGVGAIGVMVVWRTFYRPARHQLRRSTDWSDLDTIPASEHINIAGGKGQ